jgi:hypothetical protein
MAQVSCTYHLDDISPETLRLALGREESAVGVVLLGGQDERNIVLSISARQTERILSRVVDDVATSLAVVGILSSLDEVSLCSSLSLSRMNAPHAWHGRGTMRSVLPEHWDSSSPCTRRAV